MIPERALRWVYYIYVIADILSVHINALLHYDEQFVLDMYDGDGAKRTSANDLATLLNLQRSYHEKVLEMAEQNKRAFAGLNMAILNLAEILADFVDSQKMLLKAHQGTNDVLLS